MPNRIIEGGPTAGADSMAASNDGLKFDDEKKYSELFQQLIRGWGDPIAGVPPDVEYNFDDNQAIVTRLQKLMAAHGTDADLGARWSQWD